MSTYHINEGTFDVPAEWPDQTLNIFPSDDSGASECNLVISRDPVMDGEDVAGYVERQLKEMGKALPRLRLLGNEELELDGEPARRVEVSWLGEQGSLRQSQVCAVREGRALVLTLTVPERLYLKHSGKLDEVLESFRFRRA
jgi:hypothetical protein